MTNEAGEIRSTLNDLIETCKDSQQGFHAAAGKLKDPEIHTLFLRFYLQRAEFAGELQAEVGASSNWGGWAAVDQLVRRPRRAAGPRVEARGGQYGRH